VKIDNALDSRSARCDKLAGDRDRHLGIYASSDNWRTCVFLRCITLFNQLQLLNDMISSAVNLIVATTLLLTLSLRCCYKQHLTSRFYLKFSFKSVIFKGAIQTTKEYC